MATLVLGAVGSAIGGSLFSGTILGLTGAAIGGMIGSTLGSAVDSWLISSLMPGQKIEGARLDSLRITSATEGAIVPRLYGRMRVGGNIIWATDFREEVNTTKQRGGGKGGGPKVTTTEYLYYASFAVAVCEGPITGIGRIWADGKPLDLTEVVWRWYAGDEDQEADPFIAAKIGAANTPAYRGTAYVMFEDLPLNEYGNRLPQLTFEVFRPLAADDSAEGLVEAVTIIPAAGEFAYATRPVGKTSGGFTRNVPIGGGFPITIGGTTSAENTNAVDGTADMVVSLDRMQSLAPRVESASLVVSWFGSDLRAGNCQMKPKVEFAEKATNPFEWSVNGITRAEADLVGLDAQSRPVYGGTPADFSVVQAIQEMKSRGLRVTFYPFIMMDIAQGNDLPDPYSDNASGIGQPALPWRGRITCSPAAGFAGTVDKTPDAGAQVADFFGSATPTDFAVTGETVSWSGPSGDWGLRRMILHYAHLCKAAGGVDAFLIGTEMRGLTQIRDSATGYPAVQAFRALAADVRAILGPKTKISYAADWSEYFGHRPADGSNDVLFHLDPLWADPNIDFIGIDNYMPLSDWRDGFDHLDAQAGWPAIHDRDYLSANVAGGEGYDWFYATDAARAAQDRTPIIDTYPIERDVAVPRPLNGPSIIGETGLLTNSYHQVLGRDGYFHPDSGTSEGQFVMIYACARAALALAADDPDQSASWARRSRLLASTLEESFYRRPLTTDTEALFVPHWLNAARASFELQSVDLDLLVNFWPVSGGRLRGVIPASAGGDVLLNVYSVRAADATLLWQNPYSPVIGEQLWLAGDPIIGPEGAEVFIWGTEARQARVAFAFNRGDLLEVGAPYEAWPIWRRLDPGEIACAGDAMRWAILAYDAMAELHADSVWTGAAAVTRANTVRAFDVDDGRWLFKPGRNVDPFATAGLFTFASRPTTWVRDFGGGLRAQVSGAGESQIGRGIEVPVSAGETLTLRVGASIATGEVEAFLDTAPGYSTSTRYVAALSLTGNGVSAHVLSLGDFRRLSDNAALSGPLTVHGFGIIDREAAPHEIVLESARPTQTNTPDFAPYIVPFTINILGGEIIDWRGVPGTGYQAPDLWVEIGGADALPGMMAHATFLQSAQDAWENDQAYRGPFAHAYVWDRFDAEDFGEAPGSWIYDWHDPNSRWGGYQYRALDAAARAIYMVEGQPVFAAAQGICIDVVADFLIWLEAEWPDISMGPPTDFRPEAVTADYHEPHFAAIILRTCLYALKSPTYRALPAREAATLALAARAWAYMESRYVHAGPMAGTWSGGAVEWFGFWHAEIIDTLAEMLTGAIDITDELGVDPADIRARLQASDTWIENASASELGVEQGESWVFRYKDLRNWWGRYHHNRPGGTRDAAPTAWEPQSKPVWFTELGCPAVDRGTNQPNVFFDPKSSESFLPYFSRGWRDDAIQRAYLEASFAYWGQTQNNPVSNVYGAPMVTVPECAVWTWDARPYPFFPALTDVWSDGDNWRLGHWLTGRLGAVSLGALVRELCLRAGLDKGRVDVSGLWGAVEGYVINALESPRSSITTLARHFGFDAVETGGRIVFRMRGRAPVATLRLDDMVKGEDASGEVIELTRGQETELPQALKWTIARADEDYDMAVVEAQRITVDATRIGAESYPLAVSPDEAERRCRRALVETWVAREKAGFRLPQSRLALDPTDVIALDHDGRLIDFRIASIGDAEARVIEGLRQDRAAYDLPPGSPRPVSLSTPSVFGAPDFLFLDLPQLSEDQAAHRPLVAAHAQPWPGEVAIYGSPEESAFALLSTLPSRARMGVLVEPLGRGRIALFDRANALTIELFTGTLESVSDLALFAGANALAIESAPGQWEILQAGSVELIGNARYRLTRLLRGQRGTEWAMADPAPAGARVLVLDNSLVSLPVEQSSLGLPVNLRVGPAARPFDDDSFGAMTVTPQGMGLRPFAPAHLRAKLISNGDIEVSWIRRDRDLAADSWQRLEVPMSEAQEAYAIEVLSLAGPTPVVLRSASATLAAWTYTADMQAADHGAALAPGDSVTVRIAQLSAIIGAGTAATRTLQI